MLAQSLSNGITNKTKCNFPQKQIKQLKNESKYNNSYTINSNMQSRSVYICVKEFIGEDRSQIENNEE